MYFSVNIFNFKFAQLSNGGGMGWGTPLINAFRYFNIDMYLYAIQSDVFTISIYVNTYYLNIYIIYSMTMHICHV